MTRTSCRKEVAEQGVPMLGQDRFGVELHPLDRQAAMAHPHDLAVVCPRGDFQLRRTALALDRERVVARGLVRRRQPTENPGARVVDRGDLAVHERLHVHHPAAERLSDRLMTEAYAEQRDAAGHPANELEGYARLVGRARTR